MRTITDPSRMNQRYRTRDDKLSSLRFMLTMPIDQWFSVKSLPAYVFDYIYEVGTLVDLPWIKFVDDDTGQSIYRTQRTEKPTLLAKMLWRSPLFHRLGLDELIQLAYHERMGVTAFENYLLKYLQRWRYEAKSNF